MSTSSEGTASDSTESEGTVKRVVGVSEHRLTGSPSARGGTQPPEPSTTTKPGAKSGGPAAGGGAVAGPTDGDVTMAGAVQDAMAESGERVRIKEWLLDALEARGWMASVERMVHQHLADKGDATPSVAQIADHLTVKAFESVPDDVRNQLLKELLAAVSSFDADAGDGSAKQK